jgi:hypothetical protein
MRRPGLARPETEIIEIYLVQLRHPNWSLAFHLDEPQRGKIEVERYILKTAEGSLSIIEVTGKRTRSY